MLAKVQTANGRIGIFSITFLEYRENIEGIERKEMQDNMSHLLDSAALTRTHILLAIFSPSPHKMWHHL